jgi:hypothetical protein
VKLTSSEPESSEPVVVYLGNISLQVSALTGKERFPAIEAVMGRVTWKEFEDSPGTEAIEKVEDTDPLWYRVMGALDSNVKERLGQLARPL